MPHESKAKKLLCPMAMSYPGDSFIKCQGAACMAWRWTGETASTGEKWECPECNGSGCVECEFEGKGMKHEPTGFCAMVDRHAHV